jgi:hypothetical protein
MHRNPSQRLDQFPPLKHTLKVPRFFGTFPSPTICVVVATRLSISPAVASTASLAALASFAMPASAIISSKKSRSWRFRAVSSFVLALSPCDVVIARVGIPACVRVLPGVLQAAKLEKSLFKQRMYCTGSG